MLNYLGLSGILIQLSIVVAQFLLCFVLLRNRSWKRWPMFSLYMFFNAWASAALCSYGLTSPARYFWTYWTADIVSDVIGFFAAWDIYRHTFGPRIALPPWAPRRLATWFALAVTSSVALSIALPAINHGRVSQIFVTGSSMLYGSMCAAFILMILYSLKLGITWRPWSANIAGGFVLFLIVNLVASFVRGSGHGTAPWIAARVGPFAYVLVLAWWSWKLWGQEPVPESLTTEEAERLLRLHRAALEAANRLIA